MTLFGVKKKNHELWASDMFRITAVSWGQFELIPFPFPIFLSPTFLSTVHCNKKKIWHGMAWHGPHAAWSPSYFHYFYSLTLVFTFSSLFEFTLNISSLQWVKTIVTFLWSVHIQPWTDEQSTSWVFAGIHLNAAVPALIINTYHKTNKNNRAPTHQHTHTCSADDCLHA